MRALFFGFLRETPGGDSVAGDDTSNFDGKFATFVFSVTSAIIPERDASRNLLKFPRLNANDVVRIAYFLIPKMPSANNAKGNAKMSPGKIDGHCRRQPSTLPPSTHGNHTKALLYTA